MKLFLLVECRLRIPSGLKLSMTLKWCEAIIVANFEKLFSKSKYDSQMAWHSVSKRKLYGGGAQGGIFGILEYLSQTNNNLDFVEEDLRFKYFDDASVLEIVNLLSVGLASHLSKNTVPNNIPEHNQFIPSEHLQSTEYLKNVHEWSTSQKMELNIEKSNMMLFNFTHDHQFTTEVNYKNENLKIVDEKKLLGTIITTDLKWHRNTQSIVKRAYARFSILHKISEFGASNSDMVTIYTSYIRFVLEQSLFLEGCIDADCAMVIKLF